ncbi:hypothetical protein BD310DRAFT_939860 [Dichomitus squalens]|uniref:Uncharacterized protein n=1 Tax=Dichomitus squalens TaxID=114155 RepID=A0A4Q9PHU5_9APHY|nr:hypothetical protein BD310DRAFT_939860 [Dichomitus squalens]
MILGCSVSHASDVSDASPHFHSAMSTADRMRFYRLIIGMPNFGLPYVGFCATLQHIISNR